MIAISIACTGLQAHPLDTTEYYTTRSLPWSTRIMPEISDDFPVYADKYPDDLPVNSPPEYKVGYKQPPREHQFKKDQSGNASGRPKKGPDIRKNLYEDIDREIQKSMQSGGKRMTKWRAFVKELVDAAAKGDRHARKDLLEIMRDTKRWASSAGVTFILEDSQ